MQFPSLVELATLVCLKNIKSLESIGDYLPYQSVRHILLKVDSAYQLRQIELNSPQIQGETGEIWLKLIERDFPLEYKAKGYKPQNPDKWYRVWEKYKVDHDRSLQESEEKLRSALAGLREDKEKNTSQIVERRYLPRVGRKGPKRSSFGPRDNTSSVLNFGAGSRTKTLNGSSVMRKVRREVREIRNIHGSLSKAIRAPSRPATQQLKKAPPAMVTENRIAAQPLTRSPLKGRELAAAPVVAEHEQRASFITDSEEDSDEEPRYRDDRTTRKPPAQPVRRLAVPKKGGSALSRKFGSSVVTPASSHVQVKRASSSHPNRDQHFTSNRGGHTDRVAGPQSDPPSNTTPLKKTAAKPAVYLPRTQTSPPPQDNPSPPSVTTQLPLPSSSSTTNAQQDRGARKRKAVDIFMRPKKRAG